MTVALTVVATLLALAALRLIVHRAWRRRLRRGRWSAPSAWLARRLGARPDQEQVLREESDALAAELRSLREDGRALREEMAVLVEGPALDPARLDAALSARLQRLEAVRQRAAGALGRLHAALDEGQRRTLAQLLRHGPHRSGACGHA